MNDLTFAVGLANASRNAQAAREQAARAANLAREQLGEARRATEHAAATARAAQEAAGAELERLSLERQRFEAEEEARFQAQDALDQQKRAREILADVIIELSRFTVPETLPGNPAFRRRVAILEAKLGILETVRGALRELADITEFRKLKLQVSEFVRAQAAAGSCPASPLAAAEAELNAFDHFVARAKAMHRHFRRFRARFPVTSQGAEFQIPTAEMHALQTELGEVRATLKPRLQALGTFADVLEWSDRHLPPHELLVLSAVRSSFLNDSAELGGDEHGGERLDARFSDYRDWLRFARAEGPRYEEVVAHLDALEQRLRELQAGYEADQPRWREALTLAERGNHLAATALLSQCSNRIVDDTLAEARQAIARWRKEVSAGPLVNPDIVASAKAAGARAWPWLPRRQAAELNRRHQLLAEAEAWVASEGTVREPLRETEAGERLWELLTKHQHDLVQARRILEHGFTGARRLTYALILAALLVHTALAGAAVRWAFVQRAAQRAQEEARITATRDAESAAERERNELAARTERARLEREEQATRAERERREQAALAAAKLEEERSRREAEAAELREVALRAERERVEQEGERQERVIREAVRTEEESRHRRAEEAAKRIEGEALWQKWAERERLRQGGGEARGTGAEGERLAVGAPAAAQEVQPQAARLNRILTTGRGSLYGRQSITVTTTQGDVILRKGLRYEVVFPMEAHGDVSVVGVRPVVTTPRDWVGTGLLKIPPELLRRSTQFTVGTWVPVAYLTPDSGSAQ